MSAIFLFLIVVWWRQLCRFMVELGIDDVVYDGDASGEVGVAEPLRGDGSLERGRAFAIIVVSRRRFATTNSNVRSCA